MEPVPPLAMERVPVRVGVKVKALPELVMLRPRLRPVAVLSDEVARVMAPVAAVPPPSCWIEVTPALVGRQTPPIAKQPFVRLRPPVELKVEVAVVKLAMPWIESSEPGVVVAPIPTLPEELTMN